MGLDADVAKMVLEGLQIQISGIGGARFYARAGSRSLNLTTIPVIFPADMDRLRRD